MTRLQLANLIDGFLAGTIGSFAWDDFISVPQEDHDIEEIRVQCAKLPDLYRTTNPSHYCGYEGIEWLREKSKELRSEAPQ